MPYVPAPVIEKLGFMDALERLNEKNKKHALLLKNEKREIVPLFLNSAFVMALLYYEIFREINAAFTFEKVGVLLFIYIVYNFAVLTFCTEAAKNYFLKCLLLFSSHSICFYLWIWGQDKWSVAYFIGVLMAATKLTLMWKIWVARGK